MSDLKLVIGNKNYSSWSLRPWIFLKNFGIDFEEEMVFLFENDTNEKLAPYFSNEKVPILIDASNNNLQVWDTLAIIEYLAENYTNNDSNISSGWPNNTHVRAVARSISAEMHTSFGALREALPMNCRKDFPNFSITAEVQTDIDRIVDIWNYSKQNFGKNGDWLFGAFSGADAMFAPIVLRLKGYDVQLSGFAAEYVEMVYQNKHIQSWIEAGKAETQIIKIDEI